MFSAGLGCSRPVLGVLGRLWVFLAGFGCSWLVLGVLGGFLVFGTGFECSLLALGVLGLAILELLHLCNSVKNF